MDINLVPLQKQDIELVRKWRNSEDVAQYMYTETIITKQKQEEWFTKIDKDRSCKYWVIEYQGNKIGLASITNIDKTLQSCYWAFYLGDTSIRGAGIGSKIEFNVIEYVFHELNLNKLRCEVFVSNDKVIKMHEKFGFRREAYYREHCIKGDKKLDVIGLALLKYDWMLLRDGFKNKIYGN